MPRIVRSARGEIVDFDLIMIKNQLAQAPQNVEVARRQQFIDNKEESPRRQVAKPATQPVQPPVEVPPTIEKVSASDFEAEAPSTAVPLKVEPPAPLPINRKK